MFLEFTTVAIALTLGTVYLREFWRKRQQAKTLKRATDNGVAIDDDGNIDAELSYAGMLVEEEQQGRRFTGKQARFMELMRLVAEGPQTLEEVQFLFDEGIDLVVRPDGQVYVPCIENQHLSVDGEIELTRDDVQLYVERVGQPPDGSNDSD